MKILSNKQFAELQKRQTSFADQVVQGILNNARDELKANPSTTAALEIASGLVGRAFASAELSGAAADFFNPPMMNQIGRTLIRDGQWLGIIMPEEGRILPVKSHELSGGAREETWMYTVHLSGPSGQLEKLTVGSGRVVHIRYSSTIDQPWVGLGPLQVAKTSGSLSASTIKLLLDEASGPRGYLLPVPDSDGQADQVAALRSDIARLNGQLATIESQQSLAANTGQVRHREWDVIRVGSNPPQTVLDATRFATEEILSACGIPLALNVQAQGSVLREAWRIFLFGTIAPLGRIVQTELTAKIGETGISWDELKASDLAGRARAFQSMVGGGMVVNKAASLSGLMEGE